MTTIGITGSYGGLNCGDEAILTSMVASLRERLPGVSLTVFSRDAAHTRLHHDVDAVVPVRDLTRDEALREVESLDLLLLGGGGILYDGEARVYLREVGLAQQLGIPTMAYAVGAGPLTSAEDTRAVGEALGRMDAVTVRDVGAKRILEHAGVDCPVEVTADPALLLAPEPLAAARLRAEGVPCGRRLVGLSIRERGPAAPDLDVDAYHALLANTADFVVERFDADILFIPMEQHDIRLSHGVMARMAGADHAHVLKARYRPGELLGLMEHLEMLIAMRLHLLIFASLTGTPLLALPYASKVADFIDAIGVAPPPPLSADSVGTLLAAVDRRWDMRHQDAGRVGPGVERLVAESRRTLDIALGCLRDASAGRSLSAA